MQIEKKVFSKLFKGKTNLSKKVDLALGDNLQAEIENVKSIYQDLNKEIDDSFYPIRQIEKLMQEVNADIDITKFISALQNLEEAYNIETDKLRQAENDLGITIPRPAILDEAINEISTLQGFEEQVRADVNEYNGYLKMLFS